MINVSKHHAISSFTGHEWKHWHKGVMDLICHCRCTQVHLHMRAKYLSHSSTFHLSLPFSHSHRWCHRNYDLFVKVSRHLFIRDTKYCVFVERIVRLDSIRKKTTTTTQMYGKSLSNEWFVTCKPYKLSHSLG